MVFTDTTPVAHAKQLDVLRHLGPSGRLASTAEMSDLGRSMAVEGIRRRHPDYDDEQVRRAAVWLFYGEATARAAWPRLEPCRP